MAAADLNGYLKSNYMLLLHLFVQSRVNFYKNRASLFKQSHNAATFVGEASRRLQRLLLF